MTTKKRGWRWSFVPRRLITNERFLALSYLDRSILLGLYLGCTSYGRFAAGRMSLAITLGILDPEVSLTERVEHLQAEGFVILYEAEGQALGRLVEYDEDAPADLVRKRGPSILPAEAGKSANRLPTVCQPSAQIDKIREIREERREKELAPYEEA